MNFCCVLGYKNLVVFFWKKNPKKRHKVERRLREPDFLLTFTKIYVREDGPMFFFLLLLHFGVAGERM